jgi:hypothetical protein
MKALSTDRPGTVHQRAGPDPSLPGCTFGAHAAVANANVATVHAVLRKRFIGDLPQGVAGLFGMLHVTGVPPREYEPYRLVPTPALTVRTPSALVARGRKAHEQSV